MRMFFYYYSLHLLALLKILIFKSSVILSNSISGVKLTKKIVNLRQLICMIVSPLLLNNFVQFFKCRTWLQLRGLKSKLKLREMNWLTSWPAMHLESEYDK